MEIFQDRPKLPTRPYPSCKNGHMWLDRYDEQGHVVVPQVGDRCACGLRTLTEEAFLAAEHPWVC